MTTARRQLREGHAHIAAHGRALSMLNLHACTSVEECLELVAQEAGRTKEGWVLAAGARVESWKQPRWPTRAELDRICLTRPCCIMSFDHHAVAANTAAMHAGGLSDDARDPPGGVVCRDGHGMPTGVLLEAASRLVWNAAPEPSGVQRREHLVAGIQDLVGHGFTEVHDLLSPPWLGAALAELEASGQLPIRIYMYTPVAELLALHEQSRRWASDRVRLAGGKVFADGTLNSRTAWMLEPYADPLPGMERGKVITPPAELRAAMDLVGRLGLRLAVHAIGDAAVRAVLDAWEATGGSQTRRSGAVGVGGLRIEHSELIDAADVPRFAALGVVASVQPCHLLTDIEVLRRALPHRLDRVLPLRELIDAGCEPGLGLVFGSDAPIVRPNPEDSVQAAVHRRRAEMRWMKRSHRSRRSRKLRPGPALPGMPDQLSGAL